MGPRVPLSLPINRSEIYGEIRKKAEGEAREKTRKKEKKRLPSYIKPIKSKPKLVLTKTYLY